MSARPASRATVSSVTQGDAPFRKETQAFSCVADAVGDVVVTWRGLGNVTVGAEDSLDTFESAFSSRLTNVTVAGMDRSSVCSGELVYVTFEEVRFDETKKWGMIGGTRPGDPKLVRDHYLFVICKRKR